MSQHDVVVIGGGLAGMVAARELARRDVRVLILDESNRLGGKAGADVEEWGDVVEHGYHVFPGWYLNVRRLLGELGSSGELIDISKIHYVKRGEFPAVHTLHELSSVRNMLANLFSGLAPWYDAMLAAFYAADLSSQAFRRAGSLDRVSANGFLRSRLYTTERVAALQQAFVLQASSIPNYKISAMTARKVAAAWFKVRSPIFSILNDDLQKAFIDPLEEDVLKRGVEIRKQACVTKLELEGDRVAALELDKKEHLDVRGKPVLLAIPYEQVLKLVDRNVVRAEGRKARYPLSQRRLADLARLEAAPMAAMHLVLNRRIESLRDEHMVLFDSRYEVSFVDVSRHWPRLPHSVLSVIASNYAPLERLSEEEAMEEILAEISEFLGDDFDPARDVDRQRTRMRPNTEVPLFLNTVGSWSFRPGTKTRLDDLYIAGDYCRHDADLTTMEGTLQSALATANAMLERLGKPPGPPPDPTPSLPRWLVRAGVFGFYPFALATRGFAEIWEWLFPRDEAPPLDD